MFSKRYRGGNSPDGHLEEFPEPAKKTLVRRVLAATLAALILAQAVVFILYVRGQIYLRQLMDRIADPEAAPSVQAHMKPVHAVVEVQTEQGPMVADTLFGLSNLPAESGYYSVADLRNKPAIYRHYIEYPIYSVIFIQSVQASALVML